MNINDYDFLEEKYKGIIEIYPKRCLNSMVLDKALIELSKTHKIVKICNDWLRAFENE